MSIPVKALAPHPHPPADQVGKDIHGAVISRWVNVGPGTGQGPVRSPRGLMHTGCWEEINWGPLAGAPPSEDWARTPCHSPPALRLQPKLPLLTMQSPLISPHSEMRLSKSLRKSARSPPTVPGVGGKRSCLGWQSLALLPDPPPARNPDSGKTFPTHSCMKQPWP